MLVSHLHTHCVHGSRVNIYDSIEYKSRLHVERQEMLYFLTYVSNMCQMYLAKNRFKLFFSFYSQLSHRLPS